jgi:hypothetical protein
MSLFKISHFKAIVMLFGGGGKLSRYGSTWDASLYLNKLLSLMKLRSMCKFVSYNLATTGTGSHTISYRSVQSIIDVRCLAWCEMFGSHATNSLRKCARQLCRPIGLSLRPLSPRSSIPRTAEWISLKSDIAEVHKRLSSYNRLVNWHYLHAHLRAFRTKKPNTYLLERR